MANDPTRAEAEQPVAEQFQAVAEEVSVWDVVGTPPSGPFVRFGDAVDQVVFQVMRTVSTIDAVWIPFLLSFGQLSRLRVLTMSPLCLVLDSIVNVTYAVGVLIQLRTSVVQLAVAQEWVSQSRILVYRMTSSLFWLDLLSVFGGLWWNPAFPNGIAILRIVRLWRLSAGADDIYELHLAQLTSEDAFQNFLQLAWQLVLVIHIFSCSWFWATTMSGDDFEKNLQDDPRNLGGDLASLYLVYFSGGAGMLAGWSGPPSMSPDGLYSSWEHFVWSATAPVSSLCTAFVFAQLLDVVQQASAATDKHLTKLTELSSVLDSLFVPDQLKQRCLRYHSFLSIHNANKDEYESLFSSMSINLQEDIKVHLFDGLVRTAPFFSEVPDHVMNRLVLAFEEEVYGPGQFIFHKGEVGEELFFIMRGVVEVIFENVPVANLNTGAFFGELALVLDQPRAASIRARSFTMVAKLTRGLFTEVLEENPHVKIVIMREIQRRQKTTSDGSSADVGSGSQPVPQVTTPLLSCRDEFPQDPPPEKGALLAAAVKHAAGSSLESPARSPKGAAPKKGALFGAARHDNKGSAVDSEQANKLLEDIGRMSQLIDRFQSKFEGVEIRLQNMEAYIASRSPPGAAGVRKAG